MKKILFTFLSFCLLCSPHSQAQNIDDFLLLTEESPPLNFAKNGKIQGIGPEVLEEMLKMIGSKKRVHDIKVWPWARSYEKTLNEKNTMLFSMLRTESREHLFKWVGPIFPSRVVLLAKKNKHLTIKSIDALQRSSFKIGAVREDAGEQILIKKGIKIERINERTNTLMSGLKMLTADRIDIWSYDEVSARWQLKDILGTSTQDYEAVYTLAEQQFYFAFNKNTSDQLINQLQKALDNLKTTGKHEAILKKYR